MDLEGLVDEPTIARLQASATSDEACYLRIGTMTPGMVGILKATVASVSPAKTFQRRNGTTGTMARVTFTDGTGEVEAVLWDDQVRLSRDGTLTPGGNLVLRGVHVKEGYRSGIEITIGDAEIEAQPTPNETITGTMIGCSETQIIDGRFKGEVTIDADGQANTVVLWDGALQQARDIAPGDPIKVSGAVPHPMLEGWFLGDSAQLST